MNALQLQEPAAIHTNLQSCDLTMKGKVNTGAEKVNHAKSTNMVSQEVPPCARTSRTPRKAATFGKRSNSMRRNPKAEVHKAGWLYKQASSGVKQWNKRWFVLSDRCLFYYKDEKEDAVLGSLPLLSFRIGGVQPSDNITRKFAFKAEHAGTRTYYFSTDSYEEQKEWIAAMSQAAEVNVNPSQRSNTAVTPERTMVTRDGDPQIEVKQQITANQNDNGVDNLETPPLSTSCSDQSTMNNSARREDCGGKTEDEGGGGPACGHAQSNHNPNGWSHHYPTPQNHKSQPPQAQNHSTGTPQRQAGGGVQPPDDTREQHPNVVLRRGFVPRTGPERLAQRKSSMAQLQHWVNQRRVMVSQEDINSPSHYYPANQGFNYYGYPSGGPQYLEEYQLYPPGVRPDSICSAAGAYDHRWAVEDKRRSLRDGPHQVYPRDSWGAQYYGGVDVKSLRRLSIQPRSRSVPRSPSLSSGGAYSPVAHNFASPARSPSARFDRFSGRMRDDGIYADPSVYNLRRSLSSPKYDYSGDRRSINQGLYHHHHNHHNYPVSPSIHNKMDDILDLQLQRNLDYLDQQVLEGSRLIGMVTRRVERSSSAAKLCIQVPPFHDVYRELHPTLKLNEIETSKLLGRLCEQNHIVKDHEAVVHRLRMDKDSLEEALVATHQEMEKYQNQPVAMEKLHIKKETLQKQLINIRGELSQASNALTTTRMEFEALEEEAHAIHGDLWEQLNAGIQSELVRRHIQKEFWRVQDVLEGLHKNHSSRGTDTAKHKVASGASGSFSTNSPASPLSSVSLTSPLGPYSPVPGSQVSPSKQLGPEVSTGHTQRGVHPFSTPVSHSRSKPTPKPRPKSCVVPQFDTESSPKTRPTSYREPDKSTNAEKMNAAVSCECAFPPSALVLQSLNESSGRLDTVIEETTDQSIASRFGKASKATHIDFLQIQCQDSTSNQHSDLVQDHMQLQDFAWIRSNICSQEVKVGQRKDVFPDTIHASPLLVEYPNGEGNRHFSVPESPILLFQDIFQTNVLTSCHGPDFPLADTQQHQQVFHPTRHAKMPARPYDQTEPHADPMLCMVTQSDSSSQPSDKESAPPRPPLPKSYFPLESSTTFPPSIPPLPFDSTIWLRGLGIDDDYFDVEDSHVRKITFGGPNNTHSCEPQDQGLERQSSIKKGLPSRTKSPADDSPSWPAGLSRQNGRMANGISRERPKSAVFPAELRSKMSVEEQNERIRRNQSSSVRDKRRSLNLSGVQSPAGYKVIRRRLTAHEIDINDLEAAVRGQGLESPREEIARLRRSRVEPEHYDLDIKRELMAPEKVIIPERYLEMEDNTPLSPEEQKEKQKKLERIKTLIAKSNLQNVVPALDGPVEGGAPVNSQQQLQEQEKRIEISCALAAEASRRSRLLSAQCAPDPPTSPTSLHSPPSSADFPTSSL